jgi:hypothetical protein
MTRLRVLAIAAALVGVCFSGLGAQAAGPVTAVAASGSDLPRGAARVWFLRQSDPFGAIQAATPMVFANGTPIGRSLPNNVFYRDLPPGSYTFTVEPFGIALPTGQAARLQLAPGTQIYLQVEWLASWQFGYPSANWSDAPNTFGVIVMPPQLAQAYMRAMTNLSPR